MTKQLSKLIHEAEQLTTEDQLRLIAHLAQNLSTTPTEQQSQLESNHQPSETPKTGKSILQIADDFIKDLPEETLSKLPSDGAEQHDHYIYGTSKTSS